MSDSALNPMPEAAQKLSGAQILIKLLERQGIKHIIGIPGGANLPMYDALTGSEIQHVLARHEQGAGFIAQGMARVSGEAQVCFASSGPGATNLVTAVADAHLDSIPLVAITGQVPQAMIGTDAFQEVDTFGMMLPITKHNWMVRSVEELIEVIPEAFRVALSGRPGPVSVDVPKDVQNQIFEISEWPEPGRADALPSFDEADIRRFADMVKAAKRPVLMVGGGVVAAGATEDALAFAERLDLPTVCSFMGLGVMPPEHPLYLGMLGMHGARCTNMILDECDLLIGMGVRFDDRATGKVEAFVPNAAILHVDIDESEIGKIKNPSLAIRACVGEVLCDLNQDDIRMQRPLWRQRVDQLKESHPLVLEGKDDIFRPYGLMTAVAEIVGDDANISTDVGQHQMWAAQAYPLRRPRQWLSSGGLGTMGFGMPAAIGAALQQPERPSVCFSGDGSFKMNMQELETAVELGLNMKVVLLNNGHLGLVRQQQELFYGERYNAVRYDRAPDFVMFAQAMGAEGIDLGQYENPREALEQALTSPGPCLINVPIEAAEMVFPMVPPGGANKDMIGGEC